VIAVYRNRNGIAMSSASIWTPATTSNVAGDSGTHRPCAKKPTARPYQEWKL
jgi:hypothetical protein